MSAVYLTNDLFFSSRVTSAAAACGLGMSVVADPRGLLTQVEAGDVHLVVLEFSMPGLDLLDLVPRIREAAHTSVTVIAFGPHVDVAGLAVPVGTIAISERSPSRIYFATGAHDPSYPSGIGLYRASAPIAKGPLTFEHLARAPDAGDTSAPPATAIARSAKYSKSPSSPA